MWGGRFAEGPAAIMREINASIPFDKALWRQDIAASKAHVAMLGACGIVSNEDAVAIERGLDPEHEYVAAAFPGRTLVVAAALLPGLGRVLGEARVLARFPGAALEGARCRHPWIAASPKFSLPFGQPV